MSAEPVVPGDGTITCDLCGHEHECIGAPRALPAPPRLTDEHVDNLIMLGYEQYHREDDARGRAAARAMFREVLGEARSALPAPEPPQRLPTDREIGLRSALNAALVDLRVFRGADDHFVQALERLVAQTGGAALPAAHAPPDLIADAIRVVELYRGDFSHHGCTGIGEARCSYCPVAPVENDNRCGRCKKADEILERLRGSRPALAGSPDYDALAIEFNQRPLTFSDGIQLSPAAAVREFAAFLAGRTALSGPPEHPTP